MVKKRKYILSIYFGMHDSCITIASESKILLHLEAERVFRKKHICLNKKQMLHLIKIGLKSLNITINDIEKIYVDLTSIKIMGTLTKKNLKYLINYNKKNNLSTEKIFSFKQILYEKYGIKELQNKTNINKNFNLMGKDFEPIFSFHHQNHIGTGLASGFKEAVILCADGGSEEGTTKIYLKKGNKIILLKNLDKTITSGLFYAKLTQLIIHPDAMKAHAFYPGKTMGLSAYGNYNPSILNLIRKHMGLFLSYSDEDLEKLRKIFELSLDYSKPWKDQKRVELAYNGQKFWEESFLNLLKNYTKYSENLIFVGGCALNVLLNSRIIESKMFKNVYIPAVCGDSGQSLGAILYHNPKIKCDYPFLGRNFEEPIYSEKLVDNIVKDILDHKIIAWYQGRSEIGPRALGHRSFIGLPDSKVMKDKLSIYVKKREPYRPVAPIILEEDLKNYFKTENLSPYMTFSPKAKLITKTESPAVVHIDGTSRIQTISKKDNAILFEVLKNLKKHGKPPIIMNSSFNLNGNPIVDTPEDAMSCFKRSKADILYINGRRIKNKKLFWTFINILHSFFHQRI